MTHLGPLADVGFTVGGLFLILAIWLGIMATVAFLAGVVAIAIVGPRRLSAVVAPALATFVVVTMIFLTARQMMIDVPVLLLAALGTATVVAFVQRAALPHLRDSSPPPSTDPGDTGG